MRKILLVLVSILLVAGVVNAAEFTQSVNADFAAQNVGRSRATDSSVLMQLWSTGSLANPGVGVSSSSSLIVYTNSVTGTGIAINTTNAATDTVGEVVDYINNNLATDSSVKISAAIGPDAYRDESASQLLAANIVTLGATRDTAGTVADANSRRISAGVQDNVGVSPRIKSIQCNIPVSSNALGSDGVTLSIWDGNTRVWRKFITNGAWNSATASNSSANTVTFPEAKGISATKGNSLVAVATLDRNMDGDANAQSINQISIVYDKLRD